MEKQTVLLPTVLCDWQIIQTTLRQIQLEIGSCHVIYTKYMGNSKVNIFLKEGLRFQPRLPPPPPRSPETHTALETPLSQLMSSLQSPEIHQRALWCFLWGYVLETKGLTLGTGGKKMCNTCFSKSLTFQNMNCWNSLKFRIPRPKETNCDVLDGLLYLWLVDTTTKRKLFWLKLADLQLCI